MEYFCQQVEGWSNFKDIYDRGLREAPTHAVVVGTADDLRSHALLDFPPHAASFVGRLEPRQTAELIAGSGPVVGNDSGLAYAVGTPTVILFGPTPDRTLGPMPHALVFRAGLEGEPCWFDRRFEPSAQRIKCLRGLDSGHAAAEAALLFPVLEAHA
jgi:hypothetical protein